MNHSIVITILYMIAEMVVEMQLIIINSFIKENKNGLINNYNYCMYSDKYAINNKFIYKKKQKD